MWTSTVLSHIPFRVCTGINQNGEGAESFPESNQDFRRVRQTDVLSENEEETYEYLNSRLPNVGDYVTTDDGLKGEVSSVNVLRQLVKVLVEVNDEKELREYQADQLKFKPKRRRDVKLTAEEMKELAALEDRGGKSKIDDTK